MPLINLLAKLPIDFGQSSYKHKTKAKAIAFNYVPEAKQNATALDVGCGDGYWSEKFKNLGYSVTSIDMEREYPNVDSEYKYKNMIPVDINQQLKFPDSSFDFVWCSEVIEHLKNYKQIINEIQRVLKPGGTYVITTPNSFFWLHYFLKLFGMTHKDWQNENHIIFFHINDVKKLFPHAKILGYFPYTIIKFKIKHFISILSPSFVIIGKK